MTPDTQTDSVTSSLFELLIAAKNLILDTSRLRFPSKDLELMSEGPVGH